MTLPESLDALIRDAQISADWTATAGEDAQLHGLRPAVVIALARCAQELQHISDADPNKWEPEVRDQFQQWLQSRSRAALRSLAAALGAEP